MRYLIPVLVFLCSCSGKSDVPKEIMAPSKMEAVLYDIIRADEVVDIYRLQDTSYHNFSRRTALYDSVFRIHGINKTQFQKSLTWYQDRPDILRDVFESLQKMTDTVKIKREIKEL